MTSTSPLRSTHNFHFASTNHLNSTSATSPSRPFSVSESLIHAFITSTGDCVNNHLLIHSHDPCPQNLHWALVPHIQLILTCSHFSDAAVPSPPNQGQHNLLHLPPALKVITQEAPFNVSHAYDLNMFPNVVTLSSFIFYNAQHFQRQPRDSRTSGNNIKQAFTFTVVAADLKPGTGPLTVSNGGLGGR